MIRKEFAFSLLFIFITVVVISSAPALEREYLVAYWPLNGDTKDVTGKGSDGEITGEPEQVDGKYGKALLFDGKDDYVNVPDDKDQNKILDLTSGVTLIAWVRMESVTNSNPNFVAKDHAYFLGYHTGTKALRHGVHTEGWHVQVSSASIEEKTWTHVALTYDGKSMLYYKDGKQTDKFDFSGKINVEESNLTIGTFQKVENKAISQIFNGIVDEVAIFNVPLATDDIKHLMNAEIGEAFAVTPKYKLATSWRKIKQRIENITKQQGEVK